MNSNPVIILYDDECVFCNSQIARISRWDKRGIFKFGSQRSPAGEKLLRDRGIDAKKLDSVVVIDGDSIFTHSDGPLKIAATLGGAWKLLTLFRFVPRFIRDAMYRIFARNRYKWFGKLDACPVPTPEIRARLIE